MGYGVHVDLTLAVTSHHLDQRNSQQVLFSLAGLTPPQQDILQSLAQCRGQ
jgi:hypothetical protein